ncbi:HD domain-containing protein [Candidatus Uhrbacteria bacterium]|nr:HD domain-containing protein [Candidatus Uhrbacteria bacterium]
MDTFLVALIRSDPALLVLLRGLELYDGGETYGHSWRVARGVLHVARRVGWTARAQTTLARAALLHDVGKLFVYRKIVTKPDGFTEQEFAEIRQHPRFGFEMVRMVDEAAGRILIAHHDCGWHPPKPSRRRYPRSDERRRVDRRTIPRRQRQERRDGDRRKDLGQHDPQQLTLALVDIFDALASQRWYKRSWADAEIRAELIERAPVLAEAADWLIAARRALHVSVPTMHDIARAASAAIVDVPSDPVNGC